MLKTKWRLTVWILHRLIVPAQGLPFSSSLELLSDRSQLVIQQFFQTERTWADPSYHCSYRNVWGPRLSSFSAFPGSFSLHLSFLVPSYRTIPSLLSMLSPSTKQNKQMKSFLTSSVMDENCFRVGRLNTIKTNLSFLF